MQWLYLDEDFIINSCDEIWAHIYLSLHLQQISLLACHAGRHIRIDICVFVGPRHHGMARPQVADGGTASDMEGSCE